MAPKLTKTSAAVKLFLSKLRSGQITESHTPAEVWKSDAVFRQYKLPTFRTRFHKIKKKVQEEQELSRGNNDNDEDLNHRCTKVADGTKKRRLIEEAAEDGVDLADSESNNIAETDFMSDVHSFKPLYLVSEWKRPKTMNRRISVAIVLPSGVGVGDFAVRMVDNGMLIELVVRWPSALVQMEILHKKWLLSKDEEENIKSYHPKIIGFENALMEHRKQASDSVESTARIPLPFSVETHIGSKSSLAWKDSSVKIVYLDLNAAVESYAVSRDCEEFEVM